MMAVGKRRKDRPLGSIFPAYGWVMEYGKDKNVRPSSGQRCFRIIPHPWDWSASLPFGELHQRGGGIVKNFAYQAKDWTKRWILDFLSKGLLLTNFPPRQ